jgi:hypothetical protein
MPKAPSATRPSRRRRDEGGAPREGAPAPEIGEPTLPSAPAAPEPQEGGIGEPPAAPRFRIFIIDAGWNSAARRALHENFALIRDLQKEDPIYVLSRERSIGFMRRHRSLIGSDPIIAVHDLQAMGEGGTAGFHGFRLHLGILRTTEQALLALQAFTRFLGVRRQSADLEADVRANLRREGFAGAVEVILHYEARTIGG